MNDTIEISTGNKKYVFASKTLTLLMSLYFPALSMPSLYTLINSNPEFAVHVAKKHQLVPFEKSRDSSNSDSHIIT